MKVFPSLSGQGDVALVDSVGSEPVDPVGSEPVDPVGSEPVTPPAPELADPPDPALGSLAPMTLELGTAAVRVLLR